VRRGGAVASDARQLEEKSHDQTKKKPRRRTGVDI
jgi:hypothetical protein